MDFASITAFRRLFKYITGANEEGIVSISKYVSNLVFKNALLTSVVQLKLVFFLAFSQCNYS